MAEFVLTKLAESVVSQAVQRISDLLVQEAASLRRVREDVVLLQDELTSLRGFLKDADKKQEHDQRLRELVLQVKDVASDAEDVVETFIFKVTSSYIKAFHNKRIRSQINFVRDRIQIIFRSLQIYGITSVAAEEGTSSMVELQRSLRRSSANDEDNDVIILEGSSRALRAELTKEEDRLCVVSVVGMGGLGKTTLAKKVFNTVKKHFDCSAWVFISQQYVPKDVLVEILTQMKNEREKFNSLKEYELMDLLKNEIKEKRYLVVLDDIWKIEAWDSVKRAFPKGNKGSKILFTTRNRDVATSADPLSSPIEPPILTLEESCELLQRKAFPRDHIVGGNSGCPCPPEFSELGKEMAQKCGGLPLAVVVLGGLLSTKNSLGEWKKVMRDVNTHLSKQQSRQEYEGVREILALSYYDLPYYLKPCFLYLGNFSEDSEIYKSRLIRLWIGEGFIPKPTRGETEETLKEVGERYLEELIDRCMVQVEKREHTGMGVKTCRMHDLMRDLCKNKAREESFAHIIDDQSNMSIDGSDASRRLVIHPGVDLQYRKTHFRKLISNNNWVEMEQVHPNLRSLLCLGGFLSLSAFKSSNFRMLRVLEVHFPSDGSSGTIVVGGIGNLIHLRYLCLRVEYEYISLSSSIGNLHNLHTLHISSNVIGSVDMISRLIRLRHLLLPRYLIKENRNHFRIDQLKDIETLKNIPASVLIRYDALNKFTNLRKIGIYFEGNHIQNEVRRVLGSQIVESGRLTSLQMNIIFSIEEAFPSLESLSSCHSLSKLVLRGKIILQQGLIHLPESLTKLKLERSQMEQDPMPVLENKLPNLRFLKLANGAYVGRRMVCSAYGFPKLDTLQLVGMSVLREWIVEKGAMPSLKKLTIQFLSNFEMIPQGFEFLTSLKEMNIHSMTASFCEKLQVKNGIEGEDYYKVKHIPSISFH